MKFNYVQYEVENEIRSTEKQIENLLMDEETYWRQRSRVEWLKKRDRNTKFLSVKEKEQDMGCAKPAKCMG